MNKLAYRITGRFYLGDSAEQAQYVFQLRPDAPKNIQRSFLVELEKDDKFSGNALEVAYSLKEVYDSYWVNTNSRKINELIDYLEKWEEKDDYDGLLERRALLTAELADIHQQLEMYDAEEMDNWKPTEAAGESA